MANKHKILMTLVIVVLGGLTTGVSDADMVAHWALDGNTNDSAGSNDGSIVGYPVWESGRFGGALSLDGDDYVVIPNESTFDITDKI